MMDYFNNPAPRRLTPLQRDLERAALEAKLFEAEQLLVRSVAADYLGPFRAMMYEMGRLTSPFPEE